MYKNYNYQRRRLMIPEYGRHIQEMVDSLLEIEDRNERNRQAKAVIAVMGNLNPLLRDTADFTHKLWDHLFIMSDFQLDVDSPYPLPTREDLSVKPERLAYSQGGISHKHYGRNIVKMLRRAVHADPAQREAELGNIARCMRDRSAEYNQEHPNSGVILNDIAELTDGAIKLSEEWFKKVDAAHKSAHPQQRHNNKRQQHSPRQQQKNGKWRNENGKGEHR